MPTGADKVMTFKSSITNLHSDKAIQKINYESKYLKVSPNKQKNKTSQKKSQKPNAKEYRQHDDIPEDE